MNSHTLSMRSSAVLRLVTFALALVVAAPSAQSQCVDWSVNFRDPDGNGMDGTISAMKTAHTPNGDRLYIAGSFNHVGNVAARGVAVWDGTSWAPVGNWTFQGYPTALEIFDDGTGPALYAAGGFNDYPTLSIRSFAKWTGSAWVGVGGEVGGSVLDMRVYDDGSGPALWLAGGLFTVGDGLPTEGIAAWTGSAWRTWTAGPRFNTLSFGFDPARGVAVAVGGFSSGTSLVDTWTWDGTSWTRVATNDLGNRERASMAFDTVRNRLLMMGGNPRGGTASPTALWGWNGTAWSVISTPPAEFTARSNLAMAFDSARDRLVVFGGNPGAVLNQTAATWEFDGTNWTLRAPALSPAAREFHAMAYDPIRQRVVMYGGTSSNEQIAPDTWEWDGTNWGVIPGAPLGTLAAHSMVFDQARGKVIVTGGSRNGGNPASDVWEWNGSAWTPIAPLDTTPNQAEGLIVYDTLRSRLIMRAGYPFLTGRTLVRAATAPAWTPIRAGGFDQSVSKLEVHDDGQGRRLYAIGAFWLAQGVRSRSIARWDGQVWNPFSPIEFETASQLISVVGGPTSGLWFSGGAIGRGFFGKWNGTSWIESTPAATGTYFADDFGSGPRLACVGQLRYDAYNAINGTISIYDGTTWTALDYVEPSARTSAAMAYDSARRRSVMFGGTTTGTAAGSIAETLEFDGRHWAPSPAVGPSARYGHSMAFDPTRAVTLVVGGQLANGTNTGETWAYNGTWNLVAPSVGGTTRFRTAVAWDANRNKLVLFGGQTAAGLAGDTWEWNGTTWTQVSSSGPPARSKHAMAYDPTRRAVILVAGENAAQSNFTDAWAWNGTAWQQLSDGLPDPSPWLYFDKSRGLVMGAISGDLYALQPTGVFQRASSQGTPYSRYGAYAYDTTLNILVAFGGTSLSSNQPPAMRNTRVSVGLSFFPPPYRTFQATMPTPFGTGADHRMFFVGSTTVPPSRGISQFGEPCTPPTILGQPSSVVAVYGTPVTLSVDAVGTPPLAFQWRRNGVPVGEIPTIRTGTTTPQLSFGTAWSFGDAGTYDCVVSSPDGEVISAPAQFTVEGIGPSGPLELTKVVYPPDPVPGQPGDVFTTFSLPLLSSTGDVVFRTEYTNGIRTGGGIARWNAGSFNFIARGGDALPETEPSSVCVDPQPRLATPGGGVIFPSALSGGTINGPEYRNGLWYESASDGVLIARHGLEAPGTDAVFYWVTPFRPVGNSLGECAIVNTIVGGSSMPESDTGLWFWRRGTGLTLAARTGWPAPGTNGVFLSLDSPSMSDDSKVFFSGRVNGTRGAWYGTSGSINLLALGTQQAPGYNAGVTLDNIYLAGPTTQGRALLHADVSLAGVQSALYRVSPGELTLIAKEGLRLPGRPATDVFSRMTPYGMNSAGQAIFAANVACASCGVDGLFLAQPDGTLISIMYSNSPRPPGVPSSFTRASVGRRAALNDLGQIIFNGSVSNASVGGAAVFGWTADSGVFTVACPGMQFRLGPGDYRTCSSASITGPDPETSVDGVSSCLNNDGQVVLLIQFTDNTRGIWIGRFGDFLVGSFPCPTIFTAPADTTASSGQTRTFAVSAAATPPIQHAWTRDGMALTDGPRVSGTHTASLRISEVALQDAGVYRCTVSNACSTSASASFTLGVRCTADFDDGSGTGTPDGGITIEDLLYYLGLFTEGVVEADVDDGSSTGVADGGVTIDDLLYYLQRFEAGC